MVSFISKVNKVIRFAFLWDKALVSASRHEHETSFAHLQAIYRLFNVEPPSEKVLYNVNILLAHVASTLEKYELSIAAIKTALRQLDGRTRHLSDADKNYLRYYCRAVFEFCALKTNYEVFRESRSIDVTFKSLQFDKVRPHLKRNFPVKEPIASEQMKPG